MRAAEVHQLGDRAAVADELEQLRRDQRDRLGVVQAQRRARAASARGSRPVEQQLVDLARGQMHRHRPIHHLRAQGSSPSSPGTKSSSRRSDAAHVLDVRAGEAHDAAWRRERQSWQRRGGQDGRRRGVRPASPIWPPNAPGLRRPAARPAMTTHRQHVETAGAQRQVAVDRAQAHGIMRATRPVVDRAGWSSTHTRRRPSARRAATAGRHPVDGHEAGGRLDREGLRLAIGR